MKKIKKLKNTFISRNIGLTKLALKTGKDFLWSNEDLKGRIQNTLSNHMESLSHELSMMKGSVMKAGQMLSMFAGDILPEEFKSFFSQLESQSHFLDWDEVKKQIPNDVMSKLDIEITPFAAASIGQVHRATIKATGEKIALKIQYPGVKKAIEHDVRMLKLLVKMAKIIPKSMDSDLIFDEVKSMLYQEMDYKAELDFTQKYFDLCQDLPGVQSLRAVPEFCGDTLFASYYVDCFEIGQWKELGLNQAQRNQLGISLLSLYFYEVFKWGMIQTDGNKGNFKIVIDEKAGPQILLLDFGATKIVPSDILFNYQNLVRGCIKGDEELFFQSAQNLGYFQGEVDRAYFWEYVNLLATPFKTPSYDWGNSTIPEQVMDYIPRTIQKMPKGKPNGVAVYLDRKIVGVFFILKELGCNFELAHVEGFKLV